MSDKDQPHLDHVDRSMRKRDDGGPAFPSLERFEKFNDNAGTYIESFAPVGGMTLSDYFAVHGPEPDIQDVKYQMQLDAQANPHGDSWKPRRRSMLEIVADLRYAFADAMLAARKK